MANFLNRVTNLSLILLTSCFLSGCNKDGGVIEKRLAVTKTDRSIATDYDVVEFNCVNENLCFAFCQKNDLFKLFKTTDGGKNWSEMNDPGFNYEWDLNIQSIVFLDELNGMIVFNNKAFRTYDGGVSWSDEYIRILPPPGDSYAKDFIFAGKTENNEFLLVESNGNSWTKNRMFTSAASSLGYNMILSYSHGGDRHDYGHLSNGKFFYLTRDFNHWDNKVYVYDFASGSMDTIEAFGTIVRDAMYCNQRTVFATEYGKVYFTDGDWFVWNKDSYNFHEEDYNSLEWIGNYYVAVANKSISTNYSGTWQEVINPDGTGHKEYFLKVQKIDNEHFYISGKNGLFLKSTFK